MKFVSTVLPAPVGPMMSVCPTWPKLRSYQNGVLYVGGHFQLEDDEAFVIDVNDGGARYFTVPISNVWGTTMGIMDRTGSLNKAQSEAYADGTWTYVVSNADPGVQLTILALNRWDSRVISLTQSAMTLLTGLRSVPPCG